MSTSLIVPPLDAIDLDDARQRAQLRVFAAAVGDREGRYRRAGGGVVRLAKVLAITLDLLPTVASAQLRELMGANARALARKLREALSGGA
jgi:hypothetical protein